ncbi:MAG: methyltransferase [Clostridiales Family XIII bacterium]|jgi:hypothetical protein|nr:methyltransferase [Clostridiales Family XIII bacterium]
MNARERVRKALNHEETDRAPIDLGSTLVSGIHVSALKRLREKLGLEEKLPVAADPLLLVAEVEEDVRSALHVDCIGLYTKGNAIGLKNTRHKEWTLPDGTTILVCGDFVFTKEPDGSFAAYPEADVSVPPSARMTSSSLYFDCIVRQEDLDAKREWDARKDYEGQYPILSDEDLKDLADQADFYFNNTEYAIVGTYGNAGFGDAFHIPGPWMKETKGVRDMADWFMSLHLRPEYIRELFSMQLEIALKNLELYRQAVGDKVDVMFVTGTDFAHQHGLLISRDMYRELFMPFLKEVAGWVHRHTQWKVFMHTCGAIADLLPDFIETGVDIVNPVQVSASGMDARKLKEAFGGSIVFWGGGCDPQHTMPKGTPEEVYRETLENAKVFSRGGGFIGGNVHNIQYDVPPENVIAEFQALYEASLQKNKI